MTRPNRISPPGWHFASLRLCDFALKRSFNQSAGLQAVALSAAFTQSGRMSDKQLALESIQRLPEDASLDAIAERLEFLAAIRKGLSQIERGETVSQEEVKRQLAKWLIK